MRPCHSSPARKEATGGLTDTQLRALEERLSYLRELEERRATILKTIQERTLTPELEQSILSAETRARLEDSTCHTSRSEGPKARSL